MPVFLMEYIPTTVTLLPGTTLSHMYLKHKSIIVKLTFAIKRLTVSKTVVCFYIPVAVELHVSGHFSIGNSLRCFLEFEDLEIHTLTFVWNNVKWVNWTLRSPCLLTANVRKKYSLKII